MSGLLRCFTLICVLVTWSAVGCSGKTETGGDGDGDASGRTGGTSGDGDAMGTGGSHRLPPLDPCFGDLVYCLEGCVDLTSSSTNCGNCGKKCGQDEMCAESECVFDPTTGPGGGGGVGGAHE
jgi:hypothetical protein